MKQEEVMERIKELMQEKVNLIREHEDLLKKDRLMMEQLEMQLTLKIENGKIVYKLYAFADLYYVNFTSKRERGGKFN